MPPVAFTVAEPVLAPLQPMCVWPLMSAMRVVGWVMVTVAMAVQPFMSVTVTVCTPAGKFVAMAMV